MTDTIINTNATNKYNFLGEVNANNIGEFIDRHNITTGTFKDLHVGDYFISVVKTDRKRVIIFRIADLDVYEDTTSTASLQHHICIVPDISMYKAPMYTWSEDWENHGYKSSYVNQVIMPEIDYAMEEVFGSHLLEYTELLSVDNKGTVEQSAVKGILMSEMELLGTTKHSLPEKCLINRQLTLFTKNDDLAKDDNWVWLRSISKNQGETDFVYCNTNAMSNSANSVDYINGIRPRFLIG